MHLTTIDTSDGFARLEQDWDDLLARSRTDNPFLAHGWLHAWWSAYAGDHDSLRLLACRDDAGALLGVLPLYIHCSGRMTRVRRLRYLADTFVGSSGLDALVDPHVRHDVVGALAERIRDMRSEWDVLEMSGMDANSTLIARLSSDATESGEPVRQDRVECCPSVELPDSWDAYLATLSRRLRSNVRHARRALDSAGEVRVELIEHAADLPGGLRDAARLLAHSVRRQYGREWSETERLSRFLAAATRSFLDHGRLRLVFLTIDSQRVAFVLQIRMGDTMYAYQTGFDEAWAEHRVGMVLFGYALEAAIGERCTRYDFLGGINHYKSRWGATDVRPLVDIRIYRRSAAGFASFARQGAIEWLRHAVKRVSPAPVTTAISRVVNWRRLKRL